jgi:hypothetical protein
LSTYGGANYTNSFSDYRLVRTIYNYIKTNFIEI